MVCFAVVQDKVYITLDVSGQCIMDNLRTCKNNTKFLTKYLARSVLGVNAKWVDVAKPYGGSIRNGLRIQVYISFVHQHKNNINLEDHYKHCLQNAIDSGALGKILKENWKLNDIPHIDRNMYCKFVESGTHTERKVSVDGIVEQKQIENDTEDDLDGDDDTTDSEHDEGKALKKKRTTSDIMDHWNDMTHRDSKSGVNDSTDMDHMTSGEGVELMSPRIDRNKSQHL